ncbi:hypothetical protein [Thiomonas sp.]|uniref:hypothetical protein n=1 Tax=Thiomonas sp. TaxID=2047785 RepID=UPI002584A78C|nr:hypothetical protein [Thiomonas sp.]
MKSASQTHLAEALEAKLMKDEGSLLTGDALRRALGYRSMDALRKAISRGTAPVRVFMLPSRRGRFALARDVAMWLAAQSSTDSDPITRRHRKEDNPM